MRALLLLAALAALVVVPSAGAWTWPTGGAVVQVFGFDPAHPYAAGQHRGIDVAGEPGSTVLAPAAGTVTFAGMVPSSGKSVTIETADGYAVTLTHLGSLAVARGATVAEGDGAGTVGPSGDAEVDRPYVHLGVRIASNPQGYLDPLSFLPARDAAAPAVMAAPVPSASVAAPAPQAEAPAPAPSAPSASPAPSARPASD
ncbi:MAG: M23 family metallopeptidase, partial [Actinomycetota bacterium]|nr:M23 family metallopeptidase [Actinomycetota bacterium]